MVSLYDEWTTDLLHFHVLFDLTLVRHSRVPSLSTLSQLDSTFWSRRWPEAQSGTVTVPLPTIFPRKVTEANFH